MSRYIDADALGIGKADPNVFDKPEYAEGWNSAIDIINNAPTADVQEVRHGHWITEWNEKYPDFRSIYCSNCSHETILEYKFCPHCGSKMDEEEQK